MQIYNGNCNINNSLSFKSTFLFKLTIKQYEGIKLIDCPVDIIKLEQSDATDLALIKKFYQENKLSDYAGFIYEDFAGNSNAPKYDYIALKFNNKILGMAQIRGNNEELRLVRLQAAQNIINSKRREIFGIGHALFTGVVRIAKELKYKFFYCVSANDGFYEPYKLNLKPLSNNLSEFTIDSSDYDRVIKYPRDIYYHERIKLIQKK